MQKALRAGARTSVPAAAREPVEAPRPLVSAPRSDHPARRRANGKTWCVRIAPRGGFIAELVKSARLPASVGRPRGHPDRKQQVAAQPPCRQFIASDRPDVCSGQVDRRWTPERGSLAQVNRFSEGLDAIGNGDPCRITAAARPERELVPASRLACLPGPWLQRTVLLLG